MFSFSTSKRVSTILVALGFGLGLLGCAAETETEERAAADETSLGEVSSALPIEAFSMTGATFGSLMGTGAIGVGAEGASLGAGNFGTRTTIGGGLTTGTGTVGTGISTGSSFDTGPISTSSSFGTGPISTGTSFGTGPIGTSTSFDTGPVTFDNAGGSMMSISSGTGMAPVISSCLGADCF